MSFPLRALEWSRGWRTPFTLMFCTITAAIRGGGGGGDLCVLFPVPIEGVMAVNKSEI